MIAALAADEADALGLAAGAVIGQRGLERGLDRLGAGIDEEYVVEPFGGQRGDAAGQLEGTGMPVLEGRREIHLLDLTGDRLGDLAPAVAGIGAEQPRHRVEHLVAVMIRVIGALGAGEQAGIGLEMLVRRERHPLVFERIAGVLHDGLPA